MNNQEQPNQEQQHQIWMENSGYLYDRLVVHKMAWPSLTFQWLPTYTQKQDSVVYQVITATHKSGAIQQKQGTSGGTKAQYIYISSVQFPSSVSIQDETNSNKPAQIHIKQKFTNKFQCNRARYSQLNPNFIAVRVDNAPISIYQRGHENAKLILKNNNLSTGFSLQWSDSGLITADHKGNILFWSNIQENPQKYTYKEGVEDAKTLTQDAFISVGDDGYLCFWDKRSGKIQMSIAGSEDQSLKQLYSIAVNPVNRNLILTGGEEGIVKLWDARNLSVKLHKFQGHTKQVLNVQWSPVTSTIFASGSNDSKVKIWDLLRVGFQVPKDNSGTDQLLFTHEGHQDCVLDIGWNKFNMLLGSTEEKFNTLQIYQISNCIQELQHAEDIEFLRQQCLS